MSREPEMPRGVHPDLKAIGIKSVVSLEGRERFLAQFAKCQNISKACRLARVRRDQIYAEAKNNPFFAARMQEIMDETLDNLEELQLESAKERSDDRRWVLERLRSERWGQKKTVKGEMNVNVRNAKELTDAELEEIIERHAVSAEFTEELAEGDRTQ